MYSVSRTQTAFTELYGQSSARVYHAAVKHRFPRDRYPATGRSAIRLRSHLIWLSIYRILDTVSDVWPTWPRLAILELRVHFPLGLEDPLGRNFKKLTSAMLKIARFLSMGSSGVEKLPTWKLKRNWRSCWLSGTSPAIFFDWEGGDFSGKPGKHALVSWKLLGFVIDLSCWLYNP